MRDLCLSARDQREDSEDKKSGSAYSSSAWREVKRLLIVAGIGSTPSTVRAMLVVMRICCDREVSLLEGRIQGREDQYTRSRWRFAIDLCGRRLSSSGARNVLIVALC